MIGVARDGVTLINIAADLNPDVVITDFRMPGFNGIVASSMLLKRGLCKAVVLLTEYGDRQLVDAALEAGIRAVVFKIKAAEDLIPAIHRALRGETFISSLGADAV